MDRWPKQKLLCYFDSFVWLPGSYCPCSRAGRGNWANSPGELLWEVSQIQSGAKAQQLKSTAKIPSTHAFPCHPELTLYVADGTFTQTWPGWINSCPSKGTAPWAPCTLLSSFTREFALCLAGPGYEQRYLPGVHINMCKSHIKLL